MNSTTHLAARRLCAALLCLVFLALTGCGGGGDDEEDAPPSRGPVDCKARPELCI